MEHPSLALLVVPQPVGQQAPVDPEDDHVAPLLALDPVHGGQQHGRPLGRRSGQHAAEPRLEGGRVGMEGGHRLQGGQVVAMGGAVRLPTGRVEHVHGPVEPDAVTDGGQGGGGGTTGRRGHRIEVVGVGHEFGNVPSRQSVGQSPDVADRGARPLGHHVHHHGGDAPGRPTDGVADVLSPDVAGVGPDPQVGEGRAHAGPGQHAGPQRGGARDAAASMHATCTGSRAELTRASTAMSAGSTPALRHEVMISVARVANRSPGTLRTATGPAPASGPVESSTVVDAALGRADGLLDPAGVVGEE